VVQFQLVNGSPIREFDLYFMSLDSRTGIDHHAITSGEGLRRKLVKGSLSRLTQSQMVMVQEEQNSLEQASLSKSQIDEGRPRDLDAPQDASQDVASGITVVCSPMDRSPQGLGSRLTERSIEDEIPLVFCFQNGDASSARTVEVSLISFLPSFLPFFNIRPSFLSSKFFFQNSSFNIFPSFPPRRYIGWTTMARPCFANS
jgi:hypothetical protein